MNTKKQFRSFVAYICAMALIIASMAGYQASAVAAEGDGTVAEITFNEPSFLTDAGARFRGVAIGWQKAAGATVYTTYVGTEDAANIATAYHNGWMFEKRDQASVDHIKADAGSTVTLIVVGYDADGNIVARGTTDVAVPELTADEIAAAEAKEAADAAIAARKAMFATDDNLAKGAAAIACSNDATTITDGDAATKWQADPSLNADKVPAEYYFGVDLGEVKTIGSVMIAWENAYATGYEIYVAGADGVYGETPVDTGAAKGDNPVISHDFDKVDAQYIKVVPTELSDFAKTYGISLFEIGAFAEATGEEKETTPEVTTPEVTTPEVTTEDPGLTVTDVAWIETDGVKNFTVNFTPVSSATTGDADPYLYCIYLDQMDSDHSAINYGADWNWKDNFQWLNPVGGFNNAYKFDGVFTTASDFAANGKASTYLGDGTGHKVIIAAYATVADAQADTNPVAVAEKALGEEVTTEAPTTVDDGFVDAVVTEDNEVWTDLGFWSYQLQASNKSQGKIKGGDLIDNFSYKPLATQYNVQGAAIKHVFNTVPGEKYEFSFKLNAINPNEKNVGRIALKVYRNDGQNDNGYYFNFITVADGENEPFVGTYTASAETTVVEIQLGWLEPGIQLDIQNFKFAMPEEVTTIPIPDAPTDLPEGYTLVTPNQDPWVTAGSTDAWAIYAGTWSGTEYAYAATKNGENPNELSVYIPKSSANSEWTLQVQYTFDDVDIGDIYIFTLKDGDTVLKTKKFTSTGFTYVSDKIGLGNTAEGTTLNLVATCEKYDPSTEVSPYPEGMAFDYIIDSRYNALLYAEYTMTSTHGENTAGALTDGTLLNGYLCTGRGERNEDVILTLENPQDVANISLAAIDFNNNLSIAETYSISISEDGENYVEIGSYTTDGSNEETFKEVALTLDTSAVTFEKYKYVKLNLNGVNQYGYQITEFALISSVKIEKPTEAPTTPKPTTTPAPTTEAPTTEAPTTGPVVTTPVETTKASVVNVGKTKVKKASKKKSAKKIKLTLKKVKSAVGYQIKVYKTKKNAKKNKKAIYRKFVKKAKVTIKSKKLKNKKKLYVRARAYVLDANGKKVYGKWSKVKKVKIKK